MSPILGACPIAAEGDLDQKGVPRASVGYNTVTPGYFDVMKIPFLAGRDFAPLMDTAAPPQAIVNAAFVRRYLDGADALGRRVEARGKPYVIVGVVRDSVVNAFGEPPASMLYFSLRDRPSPVADIHVRVRYGAETAAADDIPPHKP